MDINFDEIINTADIEECKARTEGNGELADAWEKLGDAVVEILDLL